MANPSGHDPALFFKRAPLLSARPQRDGRLLMVAGLLVLFGVAACDDAPPTAPSPALGHHTPGHGGGGPSRDGKIILTVKAPDGTPAAGIAVSIADPNGFQRKQSNEFGVAEFTVPLNTSHCGVARGILFGATNEDDVTAPRNAALPQDVFGPAVSVVTGEGGEDVPLDGGSFGDCLALSPRPLEVTPSNPTVEHTMHLQPATEVTVTVPGAGKIVAVWAVYEVDAARVPYLGSPDPNIPFGILDAVSRTDATGSGAVFTSKAAPTALEVLAQFPGSNAWLFGSGVIPAQSSASSSVSLLSNGGNGESVTIGVDPLVCGGPSHAELNNNTVSKIKFRDAFWGWQANAELEPRQATAAWLEFDVLGAGSVEYEQRVQVNGGTRTAKAEFNCTPGVPCTVKKVQTQGGITLHVFPTYDVEADRHRIVAATELPNNASQTTHRWKGPEGEAFPPSSRESDTAAFQDFGPKPTECSAADLGETRWLTGGTV